MNRSLRALLSAATLLLWGSTLFGAEAGAPDGLPTALRLAATRHPAILAKMAELNSLGFEDQAARARRFPTLSVQAQSMSNQESQVIGRVQQPLWAGGRISDGIELSEAKIETGTAALLQLQRQVIEETAALYAILQGTRLRLEAAQRNVAAHEELYALISRRQAGNIASEADVRLADSRRIQAQAQKEALQGELIKIRNELLALTQTPLAGEEPVPEALLDLPLDDEQLIAEIERASAPIAEKEREVIVVRKEAELRQDELMPTLYARLDRDLYAADADGSLPTETRVGLVLEGSVEGVGFAGWNRVSAAKAQIRAAEANVASARNEVRRNTQSLLADLRMQRRIAQSNERLVTATEETLQSFMRQYDAGRKTWVDVLNAQKELSEAWQGLESTHSSLLETRLRLCALSGRLDREAGVQR